jgi:hypothetical protein
LPFDGNLTEVQLSLIAARDLIKNGWCQQSYKKELKNETRYCVLGALHYATLADAYPNHLNSSELLDQIKTVFATAAGITAGHIESWNDERGRQKSEVLAAFDRAIRSI